MYQLQALTVINSANTGQNVSRMKLNQHSRLLKLSEWVCSASKKEYIPFENTVQYQITDIGTTLACTVLLRKASRLRQPDTGPHGVYVLVILSCTLGQTQRLMLCPSLPLVYKYLTDCDAAIGETWDVPTCTSSTLIPLSLVLTRSLASKLNYKFDTFV